MSDVTNNKSSKLPVGRITKNAARAAIRSIDARFRQELRDAVKSLTPAEKAFLAEVLNWRSSAHVECEPAIAIAGAFESAMRSRQCVVVPYDDYIDMQRSLAKLQEFKKNPIFGLYRFQFTRNED